MIDLIRSRRSIRKYIEKQISSEIIEELKEVALRAPTSRNRKEWLFWFVTDKELLEKLSEAKAAGSKMIGKAPLAIVIGAKESECDVWIEDTSIASTLLQMNAQSYGLGSVWVQIRERLTKEKQKSEDRVKEILKVSDSDVRIASIIAMGYPDEEKLPIEKSALKWDAIQL
jgi:nitroreductase